MWLERAFTKPAEDAPMPDLETSLQQALADWHAAQRYFDSVTDPDLVDFAAFQIETARRKYSYLLRQIREQTAE